MTSSICIHATTICLNGTGVVIRGDSGAGKSDLALQVLETSGTGMSGRKIDAVLVADDQTELRRDGDKVLASAPETIRGLLEVRGQGVLRLANLQDIPVVLVVDLMPRSLIARMPELAQLETNLLGLSLPRIAIDAGSISAASRLRTAWSTLATPHQS